ncbi:MAG: ATP-grasp domain-containing protein [Burkholderiales bacterium]|nr:ATP-grasp domain-containing protein [Burkholderiales bacterium]
MFSKILIANRGEIACRVIRTARALGYRSVAVFSDADADAPHVRLADEAVAIGGAATADSYLRIDALLDAARRSGADAVHPGYGFLAERADFAQACAEAGLVFIGPPPTAIRAMGDKALAKRRMREAGVPCAPGYLGDEQDDARLAAEAAALGLPLLVKAVAGGGGRGMRLVRDLAELPAALAGARREALAAFGDGTLMLERLIERGRHIEVQVFADAHGGCIHLGERDCTAQRRRQKVVEEAPSPIVDAALRERIGADAVAAARAVGYVGAGTVEFIVDAGDRHHFLEMNTRLQVEHPVTECLTGLDLVEWQLRVAAGEPLPLRQQDVRFAGHAIEARLYAEDPYAGFAPQTGGVLHWRPAQALAGRGALDASFGGARIDAGIAEGGRVTPHYDAMVAKLIAHGRDRGDAIRRLAALLADAPLLGLRHNGRFLRDLLRHPDFAGARMHTTLIDEWAAAGEPLLADPAVPEAIWALAAALRARPDSATPQPAGRAAHRPAGVAAWDLTLQTASEQRTLRVQAVGAHVRVECGGHTHEVELHRVHDHEVEFTLDGVRRRCVAVVDGEAVHIAHDAAVFVLRESSPYPAGDDAPDPRRARAPVAGRVAAVAVAPGDAVAAGQPLLCVEAMKMEMWLHAGTAGRVAALHAAVGDSVEAGALLAEIDPEEPS